MANEILIAGQLSLTPNLSGASPFRRDWQMNANQSPGTLIFEGIGTATTSPAAVDMGAITLPGIAWFKNLDATNTLSIRNGSGGADVLTLKAGEQFAFRFKAAAAPYVVAGASTVKYEYAILEA